MITSRIKRFILTVYLLFALITVGFISFLVFEGVIDKENVEATTIFVDSSGGGHYSTIQAAINNANPGDTIIVANGTYNESITINKTNITLIGNSTSDCKIINQNNYSATITVTTSGTNISGFNISVFGKFSYGIHSNLVSSLNTTITNNKIYIHNRNGYGIYISNSYNNSLLSNDINVLGDYSYGIYQYFSSNNNLTKNNISITGNNGNGIFLQYSTNNYIEANQINITGNYSKGVALYYSSDNNELISNDINITGQIGYGIYLYRCLNIDVIKNHINTSLDGFGIYLYNIKWANLSENNMTNSGIIIIGNSLDYWDSHVINTKNKVDNKPVYYYLNTSGVVVPKDTGELIIVKCTNMSVTNQNFSRNGFFMVFSNNSTIKFNSFTDCKIFLISSNYNHITGNTIKISIDNEYGIHLSASSNNNLINNTINTSRRYGYGIHLDKSSNNNLINNSINTSGQYGSGIRLYRSSDNNLTRNYINTSGPDGHGISVESASNNNNLINNIINASGSRVNGISLYYSSNINVVKNRINTDWKGFGIYFERMESVNLTENNLTNTGLMISGKYLQNWNTHSIDITNKINTKSIYYYKNTSGIDVPKNTGEIIIANCSNMSVSDENFSHMGLIVAYSDYSNIQDNKFNYHGIFLYSSSHNNLTNNTINNNEQIDHGISLERYSDSNNILNNTINLQYGDGIYLDYSFKNNLSDNHINTVNNSGIHLVSSGENNLTFNWINTSGGYAHGILFTGDSNYCKLIGNKIITLGPNSHGIFLFADAYETVISNIILTSGNNSVGIYLDATYQSNVSSNSITVNNENGKGIFVSTTNFVTLWKNTINTNGDNTWGIGLSYVRETKVVNNIIKTNGERAYGIRLESTSKNNDIFNNQINTIGKRAYGISLYYNGLENEMINNIINTNGERGYGIYQYKSSKSNLTKNKINTKGLRGDGIYSEQSSNNEITNNQINASSGGYGIFLFDDSGNNNLTDNTINTMGERGYGIFLYHTDNSNLIGNLINTSGWRGDGIYTQQSSNNEIIQNSINTLGGGHGIFLYWDSNFNNVTDNVICASSENGYGIYLNYSSNFNNLFHNDIITNGTNGIGILIDNSIDTLILNCSIATYGQAAHGVYLNNMSATIINSTITTNLSSYDIKTSNKGIITAINCSFKTIQAFEDIGGVIKVKNYLGLQVYDDDGTTPLAGVDVEVRDNYKQIYASTGYGSNDTATDVNGSVKNILVTDCWYFYNNIATENNTNVKVKKMFAEPWEAIRTGIDMSTSHTETFYHDLTAPPIPSGLKISRVPGTCILNISWDLNSDTVNYLVYSNRSNDWKIIADIPHPQNWTLDEDLNENSRYYYKIGALDKVGLSSNLSSVVSYFLMDVLPPVIPKGLSARPVPSGDAINITWASNPDNPLYYEVLWKGSVTDDWAYLNNVTHPKNWYLWGDENLINGTTYFFKLRACYQDVLPSIFTATISVVHRDYLVPKPPTDLKAEADSKTMIRLSWSSSIDLDIEGYRVYLNRSGASSGGTYELHAEAMGLSYEVTGLLENTTYYFVVTAFDEANNTSPFSNEAQAITKAGSQQPEVISTIPENNSSNVPINTLVIITFNMHMNINTVEKVFYMSPSVDYIPNWTMNNSVLRIDFIKNLSYNTSYTITLGLAKSTTGSVLKDWPFILRFRTEKELIIPTPPLTTIEIISPVNNTQVTPGELITISGSSTGFAEGIQVTATINDQIVTSTGTIGHNGTWSVIITAPLIEGIYSIEIKIGNLSDSFSIIVKEDIEEEDEEGKEDKGEDKGLFGTEAIIGLILILFILIFVLILLLISIRNKKLSKKGKVKKRKKVKIEKRKTVRVKELEDEQFEEELEE